MDALRDRLKDVLARGPKLRLALLFGSRARGLASEDSDVDVAIWPVAEALSLAEELTLQSDLAHACGREVDLVRIDGDDVVLRYELAKSGELLFEERPGTMARFRADAALEWEDLRPTYEDAQRRFLARLARG